MDQVSLVEERIAAGRLLISRLVRSGFEITAACWMKPVDEDRWHLVLIAPLYGTKGPKETYLALMNAGGNAIPEGMSVYDIILDSPESALGQQLLALMRRNPNPDRMGYGSGPLGNRYVETAHIYPASALTGSDVDYLATGKEDVLRYLEGESQRMAGKPGEYLLYRDSAGRLIAVIAGHTFVGKGSAHVGAHRLVVDNGLVTGFVMQ